MCVCVCVHSEHGGPLMVFDVYIQVCMCVCVCVYKLTITAYCNIALH